MLTRSATVRTAGFTLIELMVTLVLLAILATLAFPAMATWIRNAKVRAVSDALQNGLRLAQAEALRRNRQAVFSLTDSSEPQTRLTAVRNGRNWAISAVPLLAGGAAVFVEAGVLSSAGADVQITGPAAVCFNSVGRLVANDGTGVAAATCTIPDSSPAVQTYDITLTGADRPLRVVVALGGQVHMCDPAKTLSSSNPDGCPQ